MNNFIAWCDKRNFISVRSGVLYVTVWMTWAAFKWATEFAAAYHVGVAGAGLDMGAVIAAVTAPISALQAFVFKVYADSRADDK